MSSGRLPLLLALCVSLFAGFVPLRECLASDSGDHGVVALGTHTHGHEGHTHGECAGVAIDADCAAHGQDAEHDEVPCCVDAPFAAGVRLESVSAARALAASSDLVSSSTAFSSFAVGFAEVTAAACAPPPAPPDVRDPVPAGVRSVVLLR